MKNKSQEQVEERVFRFTDAVFLNDNTGLIIRGWNIKDLEGRLLTLIESLGLKETQESALKGYMRREVWTMVRESFVLTKEAEDLIFPPLVSSEQ